MYVDKKLEGVKAVQTLSPPEPHLPGKTDTFVLDFVNEPRQIQDGFAPFFEATIAEPTDPNLLYNAAARLDEFAVIDRDEDRALHGHVLGRGRHPRTPRFTRCSTRRSSATPHSPTTRPARGFRAALTMFAAGLRLPRADRAIRRCRPRAALHSTAASSRCDSPVSRPPASIFPTTSCSPTCERAHRRTGPVAERRRWRDSRLHGRGHRSHDPQFAKLSKIIDTLNDRFGTEFTEADKVFVDQLVEATVEDEELKQQAKVNDLDNWRYAFKRKFNGIVVDRREANEELFEKS